MRSTTRTRVLVSGALACAVSLAVSGAYRGNFLAAAQARATDFLFISRPPVAATSTVIVGVDQNTYRALLPAHGPMANWPRTIYARALDALRDASPRVIVLELFFDAPKPGDEELTAAMRAAGNVLTPVVAQGSRDFAPEPGVAQTFDIFVRPTAAIRDASAGEGVVNLTTDRDTVIRGLPLLLRAGTEELPALALAAVARFTRRPAVVDRPSTGGTVHAAGRAIPVGATDSMLINFLGSPVSAGQPGPFPIIPLVDVLHGTFDRQLVADKIVVVGFTIRGVDEHPTPTTAGTRMWGAEILANAVETILQQRFLVPLRPALTHALIVGLAMGAAGLAGVWRPLPALLVVVASLALYLVAAVVAFDSGVVVSLVYPPMALLGAFGLTLVYRAVFEQREQRMIQDAMARYLSPAVSRWVLEEPKRLNLSGETREMTVLFSDLRNFTTVTYQLPPAALVSLLNEYRTSMTEVVFKHDGVLAQYAGDAIEAFWNAPMDQVDHAQRACAAALDMVEMLIELQPAFHRRGWIDLEMGIAINTGAMIVGNMGSRQRVEYTAVGDSVNVAARLERLTKEYGVRVVVGAATRAAAGNQFEYRFLDLVAVKGRSEPLAVWELAGYTGRLHPALAEFLPIYQRGIDLYRTRRWHAAAEVFERLATLAPYDGPSALYRRRLHEFLRTPPPADWDGVYVAELK
jgi:adenylate cyclase